MITYESNTPLPPYSLMSKETTALIITQAQIAMGIWLALLVAKDGRNCTLNITSAILSLDGEKRVYSLKCDVRDGYK